jgi:hypothetical protein
MLKVLLGLFFFGLGILVGLLEIIALLDPVGTKMADDSDPFGNPHIPWQQHAAFIIFVLACFGFCYAFWRNINKNPIKLK